MNKNLEPGRQPLRIGIDLGGTKIEGLLIGPEGAELARHRIPTPQHDYAATIAAIAGIVDTLVASVGHPASSTPTTVGIGMPGSISPSTGLVQNANSTWLNGRPFDADLSAALARPVRLANDANCFALSEAVDGAGADARCVVGIILGTGCGGGIVVDGKLRDGPRGIGGEWGHNPLPWAEPEETPGPRCWCGRHGCMETWVSGPALERDHRSTGGGAMTVQQIAGAALNGDGPARAALARHASRLARGLAGLVNVIDPDVIVIGGGLSQLAHLYDVLPGLMAPHIFADATAVAVRPPRWGDAGGARGAAWLWNGG
jgi:fructokinase